MTKNHFQRISSVLSTILAIIGVIDIIIRWANELQISVSWYTILLFVVALFLFVSGVLLSNKHIRYSIKSIWRYYTLLCDADYIILEKECTYTYLSRTELKDEKRFELKSKAGVGGGGLTSFTDKFKWSIEQDIEKIAIEVDSDANISVNRIENWHQYTVSFRPIPKGEKRSFKVTTNNLNDPHKRAQLFLSAGIRHKTKKLKLNVVFSKDVEPSNITYERYDNYSALCPVYSETLNSKIKKPLLNYDSETRTATVCEYFPIYNWKYVITWTFKNDN